MVAKLQQLNSKGPDSLKQYKPDIFRELCNGRQNYSNKMKCRTKKTLNFHMYQLKLISSSHVFFKPKYIFCFEATVRKKKHRIQLPFYYKCIYVNALTFILTTYFRKEQLSKNLTKISHYKTVKTRFITCINTFTCVLRTHFFPSNEFILKQSL